MGLLREIMEADHDKEVAALQARIAALESELAAANEAVRVLGEKHKLLVAEVDAWRTWRTRVVRYMTAEQPDPTPLIENLKSACAATDSAKAREA